MLAALVFVWSIPGATALRNILMLLSIMYFIPHAWLPRGAWRQLAGLKPTLTLYATLTVWMAFVALFISPETSWTLDEMRGQWLKSTLTFLLGIAVVLVVHSNDKSSDALWRVVATGLVAVFGIQALITLGDSLYLFWLSGKIPFQTARLTGSKTGMSYVANLLLALITAETLGRLLSGHHKLRVGPWGLVAAALAGLLCAYIIGARNGAIGILFLAAGAAFLYGFARRDRFGGRKVAAGLLAAFVTIGVVGWLFIKSDPRWEKFSETIPLALDTQTHKGWLDFKTYGLPRLSSGALAEESAYLRIAWLKEGAILALENPLGVGYGRNAFGHALERKYGQGMGHSHSSVLDFAIGAGLPGIALWLAFLGSLVLLSWRSYRKQANFPALALLFIVSGFFGRSLLDSNMRDHMMEMFMFLVGLFGAATCFENRGQAANART